MFVSFVIAFVLAVFSFYQLKTLPPLWLAVAILLVLLSIVLMAKKSGVSLSTRPLSLPASRFSWLKRPEPSWVLNVLLGFIIGWSWVFWQTFFSVNVEPLWLDKPVVIQGEVVGLPQMTTTERGLRYRFSMRLHHIRDPESLKPTSKNKSFENEQAWYGSKPTVQLSWYLRPEAEQLKPFLPEPKQTWQLQVKLKTNHGSMNLGALDYESWLYQNRIAAKGYVVDKVGKADGTQANRLLSGEIDSGLRHQLAQRLQNVFADSPFKGLYQALSYGDRSAITDGQWQVLQNTGTVHLMAISGLHMGMVALLGYLLFKALWWLGLYRIRHLNLPLFGAAGALLFASVYLVLAGFSIPTQRAYLMVVAVLLFLFMKRTFQPWSALALAALLVVLWDVRSVLSLGFWLSFLAVALIFAVLQIPLVKRSPKWQQLIWIQLVLTFGLAPYLIWSFHFLPTFSLLANLVAVPFVSFIGLPMVFLASFLALLSTSIASQSVVWMDGLWELVWSFLQTLSAWQNASITLGSLSLWQLGLCYFLMFTVLLAGNRRLRLAAMFFLLIGVLWVGVFSAKDRPQNGQAWLNVLDVGQGQALVIETQNHVLVYDTGAKWGTKMDGAKLAVLPFLRARNWTQVDRVMVSHSDMDHAGGLQRLLNEIDVKEVTSGQPEVLMKALRPTEYTIESCRAGQQWQWDGVDFFVLSPGIAGLDKSLRSDNDRSCVLKVTAGAHSILVTGDLSARGEKKLLKAYAQTADGNPLSADILVAGHHGSRYSTAPEWLARVQPKVVLFSSGYKNRYHFPAQQTLQRLDSKVRWFNTACAGGIGYLIDRNRDEFGSEPQYQARQLRLKWYHHRCSPENKGILFQ